MKQPRGSEAEGRKMAPPEVGRWRRRKWEDAAAASPGPETQEGKRCGRVPAGPVRGVSLPRGPRSKVST